jgi:hypothetical protein
MPIHINLLAETQAAEELQRRDPVRRAIIIGVLLVLVFLVWSSMVAVNAYLAKQRIAGIQLAINTKTNAYQRVVSDQKKIATIQIKLAALQKLQAARFLQGNLLNALQHATVDGVQLTRMRVEQACILTAGTDTQTNGDRVVIGRPSLVRERIIMHLDARDFSANPGDQVNKFKEAIAKEPVYFAKMLDKTNGVQLANPPTAAQTDAGKPYVTFTLDCFFTDVTR